MINIHYEVGTFLISKRTPFIIFSYLTPSYINQFNSLQNKENLYVLFRDNNVKKGTPSSLFSVKDIELIQCKKMKAVVNVWLQGNSDWLSDFFPFLNTDLELISFLYHECTDRWIEVLKHYLKVGWVKTPLLTLSDVVFLQRRGEDLEELKELALGYLFLNEK